MSRGMSRGMSSRLVLAAELIRCASREENEERLQTTKPKSKKHTQIERKTQLVWLEGAQAKLLTLLHVDNALRLIAHCCPL
eukprot:1633713-Rhodomonas_salina.1